MAIRTTQEDNDLATNPIEDHGKYLSVKSTLDIHLKSYLPIGLAPPLRNILSDLLKRVIQDCRQKGLVPTHLACTVNNKCQQEGSIHIPASTIDEDMAGKIANRLIAAKMSTDHLFLVVVVVQVKVPFFMPKTIIKADPYNCIVLF